MKKFTISDSRFANYLKRLRLKIIQLCSPQARYLLNQKINQKSPITNRQSHFGSIDNRQSTIVNYKAGNAWVGILIMLVFITTLGVALIADVTKTITQTKRAEQTIVAQALGDAGVEKAVWRLNQPGGSYTGESNINMGTGILDIAVTNIDTENKLVLATAYVPNKTSPKVTRKVQAKISADFNESGVSFHYGVQVGGLGVTMSNNAKVIGNIYTGGSISCGNGAEITGDAYVSGTESEKTINNCKIGNDAKAFNVTQSSVTRNLYYVGTKTGSTYAQGYKITAGELPPNQNLPLTQSTIDQWESWAQAGGTYNGNYLLTNFAQASLGPQKINGDLTVSNGATLTVTGAIWVTGNINFSNNAIIKLAPSFGTNSGMIIADSPTDKATYGKVTVSNNVIIQGSGNPKSYIMILSTNTGSTLGNPAINVGNNSTAVVYYSTVGMVEVSNNAQLRAVTGGGLHLSNGAQVQYDSGLADANFSAGPGGSWQIKEWQIVH